MNQEEYFALPVAEAKHWWHQSLKDRLKYYFAAAIQESNEDQLEVLDIGCGTGGNLDFLKSQFNANINWQACEPNAWACQYAQSRGIQTELSSIEGYETNKRFDIVLLIDVIYHRNITPIDTLKKIRGLMKPNGVLIINSAAMPSLKRQHDKRVMGVRRYMLREMIEICNYSGFECKDSFYWNSILTPLLWLRIQCVNSISLIREVPNTKRSESIRSDLEIPPLLINNLMGLLLRFEFHLSKHKIRIPWGASIMYIGRRK